MLGRWKVTRRVLLAMGAVILLAFVGVLVTGGFDYWPAKDAAERAKVAAAAAGYEVEGSLSYLTRQPDWLGNCDARVEFADLSRIPPRRQVVVDLRRGWTLGGWEVINITLQDLP